MRFSKNVALLVCGVVTMASWAAADTVSTQSDNLLLHQTAVGSTELVASGYTYGASNAVNGAPASYSYQSDFLFDYGDKSQRLSVTGFESQIGKIRIWGYNDLPIYSVTVLGSESPTSSLNGTSYATVLVNTVSYDGSMTGWTKVNDPKTGYPVYYMDYNVTANVGVQKSLLFDFGSCDASTRPVRVIEVQAFAPVPEPSTLVITMTALTGLLAYAWRKRK
jgi:hypothetical protein